MIRLEALSRWIADAGARPIHAQAVLAAWIQGRPIASAEAINGGTPFPPRFRAAVPDLERDLAVLATVARAAPSEDGSTRLLVELSDGKTVESVLLPRDGVCISTQVGCAVGCAFCMTGREGLIRQLGSAEIVAQVALARVRQRVKRVVLMGMGEPAHNLDEVIDALAFLADRGAIGRRHLVLSTVGDPRLFERLPVAPVTPALAISLHTTKAALRAKLLPNAPSLTPEELVDHGVAYAARTRYPVIFQWTLLAGINDGDDELERLAELLAGKRVLVNFIPYNAAEGGAAGFARPPIERACEMSRYLHRRGVLAKIRHSAGQDVEGGCGQLRARALAAR